nr:hypothetical protein CFP56_32994 [Quercus suber]
MSIIDFHLKGMIGILLILSTDSIALFLVIPFLVTVPRGTIVVTFVPVLSVIVIVRLLLIPLLQQLFQLVVLLSELFNRYGKGFHPPLQYARRVLDLLVGYGH